MNKEVILTGLRSNAELHLGNYLGAILPIIELQKKHAGEFQINMFLPDLHSFTTEVDHSKLYQQTLENVRIYTAAGLDVNNEDTFVYRQSRIPAHSELTWILSCFTYFGELSRMTQFKEKADEENVSAALFDYPVLMAADILLYGAKWVPVGEDQQQHLELTRDLAIRMNNRFGELFIVPEEWQKQLAFAGVNEGVRIRSLRNPGKKMSKSVQDPAGTIMLSDSPENAAKKVMSATTDSLGRINYDWQKQLGVTNLLQILALTSGRPQSDINAEWQNKDSYGELKAAVAEQVKKLLSDLQSKLSSIDQVGTEAKLAENESKMSETANATLEKVQKAVGLRKG